MEQPKPPPTPPQVKTMHVGTPTWFTLSIGLIILFWPVGLYEAPMRQLPEIIAAIPRNFPPDYVTDHDGRPGGFAVEVFDRVAELAGLRVTYLIKPTWKEVFEAVRSGDADLIPSVGIDPSHRDELSFTRPLETSRLALFVRRYDRRGVTNLDDMVGKTIGLVEADMTPTILAGEAEVSTKLYANSEDALIALATGLVDGLVDRQRAVLHVANAAAFGDLIQQVSGPLRETRQAIGVSKDRAERLPLLDTTLGALLSSAEFGRIYARWHKLPTPPWTATRMAWATGVLVLLLIAGLAIGRYRSLAMAGRQLRSAIEIQTRMEKELRESEARLRRITDAFPGALYQYHLAPDHRQRFSFISRGAEELYGLSVNELLDDFHRSWTLVLPEDRSALMASIQLSAKTLRRWTHEYRIKGLDGKIKWIRGSATPEPNGEAGGIVWNGILVDITDRKQIEEQMRLSAMAFEHTAAGILVTDPAGRIIRINQAFSEITGYPPEELLGHDVRRLRAGSHERAFDQSMWTAITRTGRWQCEILSRRRDGKIRTHWLSVNAVQNFGGSVDHYIWVVVDISSRKEPGEEPVPLRLNGTAPRTR